MGFGSILLLAVGLAMDAVAVAAARGIAAPIFRLREALVIGVFFGVFQGGMPVLGWQLGALLGPLVERWDHWIAFALLVGLGSKMLVESWKESREPDGGAPAPAAERRSELRLGTLIALSVATSIDAFAVGITLPMLGAPLLLAVVTIGVTTAVLSAGGFAAGRRFGDVLGRRVDIAGGLALIVLGTKILLEHLGA